MNKVSSITDRLADKRREKQVEAYRQKAETLVRIVQCTSCPFKCAMCGYHVKETDSSSPSTPAPFAINLCPSCRAEFEDFLTHERGGEPAEIFWHNAAWFRLWSSWLEYQRAVREFKNSSEFREIGEKIDR